MYSLFRVFVVGFRLARKIPAGLTPQGFRLRSRVPAGEIERTSTSKQENSVLASSHARMVVLMGSFPPLTQSLTAGLVGVGGAGGVGGVGTKSYV